ncbi:MAG: hypothetical protein R3F62_11480 [Planctomycetota bacterium]
MHVHRSAPVRYAILIGTLLGVVAASLTTAGCNSKSGSQVPNGSYSADLAVMNNGSTNLGVYVDGDRLGTVPPGVLNSFNVFGGTRTVHLQEDAGNLIYFGTYTFFNDQILRIDYQPGLHNLEVVNNTGATIHVLIDGREIADVQPQTSSRLVVAPGIHDVHFRSRGSAFADFIGTINFPSPSLGGGQVLTYGP